MNYWIFFFFEKNNNNKWCLRIKLSFCFWRVEYCGGNEWKREVEWSVQRVKGKRKERILGRGRLGEKKRHMKNDAIARVLKSEIRVLKF